MPVIMKENVQYGYTDEGVKAHTLSYAEYQALSTEEKMNGDLYFIPDKQPEGNPSLIWDKLGTATLDTDADNVSDAVNELNSKLVPIIKSKDGFTFIATKLSETHYLIEMLFQSNTGITASGITLPFSVKPLRALLFTGKANDGSDKWSIPFRLGTSGTLDARSNDNNSSIAVTWVAIHVVFIGTANFN